MKRRLKEELEANGYTTDKVAEFIRTSVDDLLEADIGCCTLKLDDKIALCVGWSGGFGNEKDGTLFQSKTEPDYALVIGLKDYRSDADMLTDFDWIDDAESCESTSINPKSAEDGYRALADEFIKEYNELKSVDEKMTSMKRPRRVLKEDSSSDIDKVIRNHFDIGVDGVTPAFLDVVKDVVTRIDFDEINDDNIYDRVEEECDNSLIYYRDQWTVLETYCTPYEANWNDAYEQFINDITAVVEDIIATK